MHAILGATRHIGSELTKLLLARGEPVTIVARSKEKAGALAALGAEVAVLDVHDVAALHAVLRRATRAFVLNPPAPPGSDTVKEERATARTIVSALEGTRLERIVAESTYGAQPGENLGDLGVLFELEQLLAKTRIPTTILRGAYYFSNWDAARESAARDGVLPTFFPVDFVLPMVAPADVARVAAQKLEGPAAEVGTIHVEGPARYSAQDVARELATVLGREVRAQAIPAAEHVDVLTKKMGFSDPAAKAFAAMTKATLAARFPQPLDTVRGPTSLASYFRAGPSR